MFTFYRELLSRKGMGVLHNKGFPGTTPRHLCSLLAVLLTAQCWKVWKYMCIHSDKLLMEQEVMPWNAVLPSGNPSHTLLDCVHVTVQSSIWLPNCIGSSKLSGISGNFWILSNMTWTWNCTLPAWNSIAGSLQSCANVKGMHKGNRSMRATVVRGACKKVGRLKCTATSGNYIAKYGNCLKSGGGGGAKPLPLPPNLLPMGYGIF